jgi:photosystem II stability/assembly factor-like uncharacterized protein
MCTYTFGAFDGTTPWRVAARRKAREEEQDMRGVRVLVGTRKGAFVLTSDEARRDWDVSGPHFPGGEIFHLKASPVDPDRIYVSQASDWFGQVMHRSNDGGQTWETIGNDFAYDGATGAHLWYDGTPHPWEFKRVWHLEPSPHDVDTVYAGVEDAALFKSTDGGQTWRELKGLRTHASGTGWQPGAGGLCLHTVLLHPTDPDRIVVAISAAGAFRSDDAGETWTPINRGLASPDDSDPEAETGYCVHNIAMNPTRPDTIFMQNHYGVMRTDDGGGRWHGVSGNLPSDFGFPVGVHAHEPETIYVVPITTITSRRTASSGSIGPGPAATSGKPSLTACPRRTATSTSCATRCPSTAWHPVGSMSARPAVRSTPRPIPATIGRPSSTTCRP